MRPRRWRPSVEEAFAPCAWFTVTRYTAPMNTAAAADPTSPTQEARTTLREKGFAFVPARRFGALLGLEASDEDWRRFAESWNDMPRDTYMADGGRYRFRRHATLSPNHWCASSWASAESPFALVKIGRVCCSIW